MPGISVVTESGIGGLRNFFGWCCCLFWLFPPLFLFGIRFDERIEIDALFLESVFFKKACDGVTWAGPMLYPMDDPFGLIFEDFGIVQGEEMSKDFFIFPFDGFLVLCNHQAECGQVFAAGALEADAQHKAGEF